MSKAEMKILEAERLHQPMMISADTVPTVPLSKDKRDDYLTSGEKDFWTRAASEMCL